MIITIKDVEEHFDCSLASAAKITNILLKAVDVRMDIKKSADFNFAGTKYTLIRTKNDWCLIRYRLERSNNLDDLIR